jgi:hypothetical protein
MDFLERRVSLSKDAGQDNEPPRLATSSYATVLVNQVPAPSCATVQSQKYAGLDGMKFIAPAHLSDYN